MLHFLALLRTQVCKARAVACAHIIDSTRSVIDAGRQGLPQTEAVDSRVGRMMYEAVHPAMSTVVVADVIKQMLRTDFVSLMQGLCPMFKVPVVPLGDLITFLKTGGGSLPITQWLSTLTLLQGATHDMRVGMLPLDQTCLITCEAFRFKVTDSSSVNALDLVHASL
jgi:hypothetical protein